MSHIELAPEVGEDLDRIFDYLAQYDVGDSPEPIQDIIQFRPLPCLNTIHSLAAPSWTKSESGSSVYAHASTCRYVVEIDTVFVLTLRSQRETGYVSLQLYFPLYAFIFLSSRPTLRDTPYHHRSAPAWPLRCISL